MRLACKVEVQPTPTQVQALLQHAGNARWAYNWGLSQKKEAWAERKSALDAGVDPKDAPKVPTAIDLHRELNKLKKTPIEDGGVPWMYSGSKAAPQESLRNLDRAFQNFFRRVKTGERAGYPRFKSRNRGIGGFTLTGAIRAEDKTVVLPRLGRLRVKPGDHGYILPSKYSSATVTERAGRWYVSVIGPEVEEAEPNGNHAVGVDLGVARLATLSDGTVFENPRALASGLRKIKRIQKDVSRKKKGSANRRKAKAQLARAHARVSNVRANYLHQITTTIAKNHGKVVVEDLKVRNMTRSGGVRKRGLNRVVLDASFSEFRRLLEYKGKLYGSEIVAVPAPYTSQRCSVCGYVDAGNRTSQARFQCLSCGFEVNADLNAAINILAAVSCTEALNAWSSNGRSACGSGADVRRVVPQLAVKQESAGEVVA